MAEKLCRPRHLVAEQFAVFFGGVLYRYGKERKGKEKEEIVFFLKTERGGLNAAGCVIFL